MKCPKCNLVLKDEMPSKDSLMRTGKGLLHIFKPVTMIGSILLDLINFNKLQISTEIGWCAPCKLFAIRCPHCSKIGHVLSSLPDEGKKLCDKCYKEFYYTDAEFLYDVMSPPIDF